MKTLLISLCLVGVALVSGCASGPDYASIRNSIPPLGSDNGRIYIYRTTALGTAIQPEVKVNDVVVGKAQPEGFFYIDRPAGDYVISCSTEVERKLSLTLERGQTRYVRLGVSLGFLAAHVYPELVDTDQGEADVAKCKFIGTIPGK
jgi:hypothetical protein